MHDVQNKAAFRTSRSISSGMLGMSFNPPFLPRTFLRLPTCAGPAMAWASLEALRTVAALFRGIRKARAMQG